MRPAVYALAILLGAVAPVSGQPVGVNQVDRGPATHVRQLPSPPLTAITQLPSSARIRPQPVATRIVQQPVAQAFVSTDESASRPEDWNTVTDDAPIVAASGEDPVPSVGAGVTVILTPQTVAQLPSVGPGAVAN